MPAKPTAALFDIGNVLVDVDFSRGLAPLVPAEAGDPGTRLRTILDRIDDLETGRVSPSEFIGIASRDLSFSGSEETFRTAWNSIFHPVRAMWPIVSFLKSLGIKLVLFSNTNSMHISWLLENYEVFEDFEGRVFSHDVGLRKPDPSIYRHAIETFDLTPEKTLYLDDLPENIATGRSMGLRCHQYAQERHHQFIDWLDQELGMPAR